MLNFSIIITCHNQKKFIADTVNSALSQHAPKEVIVVDDASTDGSLQLLLQFGDKIRLIGLEKNQGPNEARNAGATAAKGNYFVFLDGDDLLLPWALEVYSRIVSAKNPKIILGRLLFFEGRVPATEFDSFGSGLQVVGYPNLIRKDRTYRGSASAIVIERNVFGAVGGWTREFFPSDIDDLVVKLGYSGHTVHVLSHPTTLYRIHESNTVHQVGRFLDTMRMIVNKEKRGEYPGGRDGRLERYTFIGGPVFFWFMRGMRKRIYWPSLNLLASGWLMVLTAIASKAAIKIRGSRPVETIEM
jgi:glycosyltransferase involved in cell wall biosynthesis